MTRTLPTFRAHAEALDALGRSKTPPTTLLQRSCATFAQMVADMTGERCSVMIGQTVIAREHDIR